MTTGSEPFLLTVTAGPNAGAGLRLGEGRATIGGAEADDIIIAGLGGRAVDLRLAGGMVRITPRIPDIRCESPGRDRDDEDRILAEGRPQDCALPVHLHLDPQTSILLARTAPLPASRRGARLALVTLALGLGAGLAAGIGAQDVLPGGEPAGTARITMLNASARAQQNPAGSALSQAPSPAGAPATSTAARPTAPCTGPCVAETARELRARLAEGGLGALAISAEQGVLRVSGNLDPAQAEAWRRIRAAFEAEHGQSLPIVATLGEGPPGPGLSVASVWLGAAPELRTRAGTVLRVGDVTPDGWTIRAIQRGAIRLGRGEQELTVRF